MRYLIILLISLMTLGATCRRPTVVNTPVVVTDSQLKDSSFTLGDTGRFVIKVPGCTTIVEKFHDRYHATQYVPSKTDTVKIEVPAPVEKPKNNFTMVVEELRTMLFYVLLLALAFLAVYVIRLFKK